MLTPKEVALKTEKKPRTNEMYMEKCKPTYLAIVHIFKYNWNFEIMASVFKKENVKCASKITTIKKYNNNSKREEKKTVTVEAFWPRLFERLFNKKTELCITFIIPAIINR